MRLQLHKSSSIDHTISFLLTIVLDVYCVCSVLEMANLNSYDLDHCLSVQPRKKRPATSKATQELVEELLALVHNDSNKAMGMIKQIMYYHPDKSLDWYCEQAIKKLNQVYSLAG